VYFPFPLPPQTSILFRMTRCQSAHSAAPRNVLLLYDDRGSIRGRYSACRRRGSPGATSFDYCSHCTNASLFPFELDLDNAFGRHYRMIDRPVWHAHFHREQLHALFNFSCCRRSLHLDLYDRSCASQQQSIWTSSGSGVRAIAHISHSPGGPSRTEATSYTLEAVIL